MTLQTTSVSELFSVFDQATLFIKKNNETNYLTALCETAEGLLRNEIRQEPLEKKLKPLYERFNHLKMTAEEVRRAFQLALLKGMKEAPQPNQELTPDTLVLLIGHMFAMLAGEKAYSILDPAVGSANLLTGILNQSRTDKVQAYGIDADPLLVRLAAANANLQQKEIQLFHQDGLKPIMIEPADFVVCDVPVGIYPDQRSADTYLLKSVTKQPLTHFLFVEQALRKLKTEGYALFLIPNHLFTDDQTHTFHDFLKKNANILALIQLPVSLFNKVNQAKSILLLQKKSGKGTLARQALLAEMPDFSDEVKMRKFMQQLDHWFLHRSV
ncbi:class I SAM-dependent methyltransferase [Sporolactobacillus sp. CPB3-1]|uniref:Class I SAM-dependent methyltransferase n=1 Tax=Sporolactobacillus mangiferae TaxID=2940498 RepID=A0ABT0M700_9BACL|nr:class I SAM-dependent methyltransferase [Sporolactobacillus mangiferae]MCL1630622.1 class I SAM-dependent methyltransferase [Sporolactobacillus mangiferae]